MTPSSSTCYALLDDASTAMESHSRLYTGFVRELVCTNPQQLQQTCGAAEAAMLSGLHAVLLADYDFGLRLQGVASSSLTGGLRILLFERMQRLVATEVDVWLAAQDEGRSVPGAAGLCNLQAGVTRAQYDAAIAAIQDWLRAGDCYQINYTFPWHFQTFGTPLALYRRLRVRQPAPYGALIVLPDGRVVLSCSPELFVQHRHSLLTAQPMKGTAHATGSDADIAAATAALRADAKNRAENLMIVDLLRNDLGRIAQTGSVRVPELFAITRYADVLQMTSTVEAQARPGLGFAEVLQALFPCGSITGAPKRRVMELIAEVEAAPRGLYTGAIGWLEPGSSASADAGQDALRLGDFCLSVAIRTLVLQAPVDTEPMRAGSMGVGGGIVIDSHADDEYAECQIKAQFLTGLDPGFHLFETLRAARAGCAHFERHLVRLQSSAAYFGFSFDRTAIMSAVHAICACLPLGQVVRLRLSLTHDGETTVTHAPLFPLQEPVRLLLSPIPMRSGDMFLKHKTSLRASYDQAWQTAEQQGAFDMLFFNERGELTEGARSNVFVLLDGRWITPPLGSGLLPGVMRAVLLDDPAWKISEGIISRTELLHAEGLMVCNALRGVMKATIQH